MAIRIKTKIVASGSPPGGWVDTEPQTGIQCQGSTWRVLVERMMDIHRINKLEIPADLAIQIETRIAARLPADCVYDDAAPKKTVAHRDSSKVIMQLSAVEAKTKRIKDAWERSGKLKVTQAEAEARAKTCLACPLNRPAGCLTCNGIFQRMQQWLGKLKTSHDKRLHVCASDMVFNKVNVWLHSKVFIGMLPKGARLKLSIYPESCWKRKELEILQ
jgi:hypothetical protein